MSTPSGIPREEYQAALAARAELGDALEPAVVDSFVAKVEDAVALRASADRQALAEATKRQAQMHNADSTKQMVVAIVSLALGLPVTAVAGNISHFWGIVIVWIGIAIVNIAMAMGRRRDQH